VNESFNPYAPPKANVEVPTHEQFELEPVGKGKRFATYLIDYILINIVVFILAFMAVILFGNAAVVWFEGAGNILVAVGVILVYYVFFESLWARTPAKFMLGTIVVMEDGGKPPFNKIFVRTLCRFIPFEQFSFFGDRGWHDSIPKTLVVSTRG
jgi:uncharacterized RDD family membrane protein YckC